MENKYHFNVYYENVCVWSILAHTKWEAIDRAYNRFIGLYPNIIEITKAVIQSLRDSDPLLH